MISPTGNNIPSTSKQLKMSIEKLMLETTFHAIPNIARTENKFVKLMWALCLAVSTSVGVYFVYNNIWVKLFPYAFILFIIFKLNFSSLLWISFPGSVSSGSEGSDGVGSCRVTIFLFELMLRLTSVFARAGTNGAKPELADFAKMLEATLTLALSAW